MNAFMDNMRDVLSIQDNPKVGIFWYDVRDKELFGVVAVLPDNCASSHGLKTVSTLQRDFWKKQFHKQKFSDKQGPYVGDYQDTPRGRVFCDKDETLFIVKVGSWINTYPQAKDFDSKRI
jgi:hypothetical protein